MMLDDDDLSGFVDGSCIFLPDWMDDAGIPGRSDLLNEVLDMQGIVDGILEDFQSFTLEAIRDYFGNSQEFDELMDMDDSESDH